METNIPTWFICPRCGYIDYSFKPSKFPICECCDYEDPVVLTNDEYKNFVASVKSTIKNQKSNEELSDIIDESFREKYVYPSEHFSKKAYNDMLRYSEEKKRRIQEEHDRIFHTPKCPTCGSTDLRKVSVGAKAVSVGLFGIFSQKVKKTWHCNSCGYEW